MIIENYGNWVEKETKFTSCKIDNKKDLDDFLNKFGSKSTNKCLFRGCNEAKYKLFTSGQRAWSTYEIKKIKPALGYLDFIKGQVKNALKANKKVLERFYSSIGIYPYSITVLSFLQHYGGNTPLLDFTSDINIALYFATENISIRPNNEIDNYFSIYIIEKYNLDNFDDIIREEWSSSQSEVHKKKNTFIENIIERTKPFFVEWGIRSLLGSNKIEPFIVEIKRQNLNIINQKGLFVYNPDCTKPLEDCLELKTIRCFNVHKSLSEYVKFKIKISEDFIYPKEEEIAKMAISTFLTKDI